MSGLIGEVVSGHMGLDIQRIWVYQTKGAVMGLAATMKGERILTASKDQYLYYMNNEGEVGWKYKLEEPLLSLAMSPDGKNIYVGGQDKKASAFSPEGDLLWSHRTNGWVSSVSTCPAGLTAVASFDKTLYVVDSRGSLVWKFRTKKILLGSAVNAGGTMFAICGEDKALTILDRAGTKLWAFGTPKRLHAVAFSPDGETIGLGGLDGHLYCLDTRGGLKWKVNQGACVRSILISKDWIAAGNEDGYVKMFDHGGNEIHSIKEAYPIRSIGAGPDFSNLILGLENGDAVFYRDLSEDEPEFDEVDYSEGLAADGSGGPNPMGGSPGPAGMAPVGAQAVPFATSQEPSIDGAYPPDGGYPDPYSPGSTDQGYGTDPYAAQTMGQSGSYEGDTADGGFQSPFAQTGTGVSGAGAGPTGGGFEPGNKFESQVRETIRSLEEAVEASRIKDFDKSHAQLRWADSYLDGCFADLDDLRKKEEVAFIACPYCGSETLHSSFCAKCGARLG